MSDGQAEPKEPGLSFSGASLELLRRHLAATAEAQGQGQAYNYLINASDHDFYCRCDECKEWWRMVGPEENGSFGPFSREEIYGA